MKKPRKRGAPRGRQVNGVRFVLRRSAGVWGAIARYSDAAGAGHLWGTGAPSRRALLSGLHDAFAPRREARA